MTTKQTVDEFLGQRKLAVVGVSRNGRGFGYSAWRALSQQGYEALPVNPQAESIDGVRCYHDVRELPRDVGGVLIVVPPQQAVKVVEDVAAAGIPRVWLQQGAGSEEALAYCAAHSIDTVSGRCILMFADPHGIHKLHRWISNLAGTLPQ
jgi:uncharacterized protein